MNKNLIFTVIFFIYMIALSIATIYLQNNFIKVNQSQLSSDIVISQLLMPEDGYLELLNADKGLGFVTDSDSLKSGLHNNFVIKIPEEKYQPGESYKIYIYSQKDDKPIRDLFGRLIYADINPKVSN